MNEGTYEERVAAADRADRVARVRLLICLPVVALVSAALGWAAWELGLDWPVRLGLGVAGVVVNLGYWRAVAAEVV